MSSRVRLAERKRETDRRAAELARELAGQAWFVGCFGAIDQREPDISVLVVRVSDMHAAVNLPVPYEWAGLPVVLRHAADFAG